MEQTLDPRASSAFADRTVSGGSAASWPAIFAGAFVAAAVSIALLALGSGLGFASVSPWPGHGVSATTFAITTAIWLIVMQWVSAAVGGYLAGRLRTRWVSTHVHEVFFRDTAHGFITWAVATVLVAGLLAASTLSAIGWGAHAASSAVANVAAGAGHAMVPAGGDSSNGSRAEGDYSLDKLFRRANSPAGEAGGADPRVEATHIIVNALKTKTVPDADRTYLAQLVAAYTGTTQEEAQKRVDEFITSAMQAEDKLRAEADAARKAAAETAIFTALSMFLGAFIASVSAALGGRLRDEHP